MVIRNSLGSQGIIKKLQENNNKPTANYINMKKEIEAINKGQEEMKNTIPELKNRVEGNPKET